MEDYPKNSVQHNLKEGLVLRAIDKCVMQYEPFNEALVVGETYVVEKHNGRFSIKTIESEHHEFDHGWDEFFELVDEDLDTFVKLDTNKNRLELIEPEFILGIGRIVTFGAIKYDAYNWQKADAEGIERIKGAMLRHTMAYMSGEKLDPETGESHLYHIGCNLMFLDYFDRQEALKVGQTDDKATN